jgi:hypothetical protein
MELGQALPQVCRKLFVDLLVVVRQLHERTVGIDVPKVQADAVGRQIAVFVALKLALVVEVMSHVYSEI